MQPTLTFLTHQPPKAHNSELKINNFLYKLSQQKSVKTSWQLFWFCTLGTNGLTEMLALL